MGIFKRAIKYRSDRGDEFELDEMKSSHLLNVISHHRKQLDIVSELLEGEVCQLTQDQGANLLERQGGLVDTISLLATELANRSAEDDAKREGERDHYHR